MCFQFGYTSAFGCYATHLLLRSGHPVAPVLPHVLCNYMGFPQFSSIWGPPLTRAALLLGIALFLAGLWLVSSPTLYSNGLYGTIG